jgi:hypothetical protein
MSVYDDVELLQQQMAAAQTNITNLQNAIAALNVVSIAENTDLNSLTIGQYLIPTAAICGTLQNKPTTSTATGLITVNPGGNAGQLIMQYIPCKKADATYYQRCYYENSWGEWQVIPPPVTDSGWLDLPLATGITAYSDAQKPRYRKIGNEVFLSGVYKGVTASNITIATLPEGFRPTKKIIFTAAAVGQIFDKFEITTSGEIVYNRSTLEPITEINWHSIACNFAI